MPLPHGVVTEEAIRSPTDRGLSPTASVLRLLRQDWLPSTAPLQSSQAYLQRMHICQQPSNA